MAKHISDFSKLPDEIVFDLINEQNGTALDNSMVTLGTPVETTAVGVTYNTDILVTARMNSDYAGQVTLGYNRLDIQGFLFGAELGLSVGNAVTYADLIPEINAHLGVNITADDFIDGPIGEWQHTPDETKQLVIPMNPTSKVFVGSLTLTLSVKDIPLSEIIQTHVLSGLVYQPPV